jgi:hypothetical protein
MTTRDTLLYVHCSALTTAGTDRLPKDTVVNKLIRHLKDKDVIASRSRKQTRIELNTCMDRKTRVDEVYFDPVRDMADYVCYPSPG